MAPGNSRRRRDESRENSRDRHRRSHETRRSLSAPRGTERRNRNRERSISREREHGRRDKRRHSKPRSRSRNTRQSDRDRQHQQNQPPGAAGGLFDELLADGVGAATALAGGAAPPPPPPPDEAPPLPADPVRQEELDAAVAAAVASISARVAERRESDGAAADAARRRRRSGWDEVGPDTPMAGPPVALQAALALPLGLSSPPPMTLQEAMNMSSTRPSAINMQVQQSCIGYLIGKGGESLKAIQSQSSANIQVDQSFKDSLGVSIMRISGSEKACAVARALIDQRVQEVLATVKTPVSADQVGVAGVVAEFKVEQTYVGFFIGKGGEQVKKIKHQTGANVIVDQSTKDDGYSTVRIMNSPGWEQAKVQVEHRIDQAREATLQNMAAGQAEEMSVPQALVGWLIGKGGEGLKSVKQASGATVVLNQDTKDKGYSVMRFAGDKEAIAQAKAIVQQRVIEADSGKGGAPPPPPPPGQVGGQASGDSTFASPAWNGGTSSQSTSSLFPGLPPPSAFAEMTMSPFSSPFMGGMLPPPGHGGLPGVVPPPHFVHPAGGGPSVVLPPSLAAPGYHPRTVLPPSTAALGGKGFPNPTPGSQTVFRPPSRPPMQVLPPMQMQPPGTGQVVLPPSF